MDGRGHDTNIKDRVVAKVRRYHWFFLVALLCVVIWFLLFDCEGSRNATSSTNQIPTTEAPHASQQSEQSSTSTPDQNDNSTLSLQERDSIVPLSTPSEATPLLDATIAGLQSAFGTKPTKTEEIATTKVQAQANEAESIEPEKVVEAKGEKENINDAKATDTKPADAKADDTKPADAGAKDLAPTAEQGAQPSRAKAPKGFAFSIRTNLLYDATLVPNIGVELHLGRRWAVGANIDYAWWSIDKKHLYWRIYGGEITARKYFGRKDDGHPLSGHHIGLYAQAASYDFELGGRGALSNLNYGAGIDYGYSLPIGRSLNLDLSIGFGYIGGEYRVYEPIDECYVWQENRLRRYIGPSKAEISLVWLLGGNKTKKGGRK